MVMLFHFGISANDADIPKWKKKEREGGERGDKNGKGAFLECYYFALVATK
jgi:hypothetical protein